MENTCCIMFLSERRNILTNKKKTEKSRELKKLKRTVNTLTSIVDSIAISMKGTLEDGECCDIKQLKELTGAAKELSALIFAVNPDDCEEDRNALTVRFEGGEEWAK